MLAVSGGADSMALLRFFAHAGAPRFGARLHVVHVHHGLRASADGDEALVQSVCAELGLPLAIHRLDPASRRSGESVEMWARRERYRCFAETAATLGDALILTGHHRDDLVETFFQRLGRGTGARGLGGIPFLREDAIARPFLSRSRGEIEAYLSLIGQAWREDETNADAGINRNWYRHRYLPQLRRREPDLDARVFAMAMQVQGLGEGLAALEDEADLIRKDAEGIPFLPRAEMEARLADGDFQSLAHWLRRLAEAAVPKEGVKIPLVTEKILREWQRQWLRGTRKLRVRVGPGLLLDGRKNGFYLEISVPGTPGTREAGSRVKKPCLVPIQRSILDLGAGSLAWRWDEREYELGLRRYPRPAELRFPEAGAMRAIFDADLFSCTLLVRTRKDGDRFSPLGIRSESRKLKVFLNEKQIPSGVREHLPLIFAGRSGSDTLAWVPGHGISDFFKVGAQTANILEMELICRNP